MAVLRAINAALSALAIMAVRGYQRFLSPLALPTCRYTPPCSQYMIDAIRKKGCLMGVLLGTLRILRCNPLFRGGHDPVK